MAQAFLVWRKNGILYKQCFGDCRGGALLHSPSFIAVSCLSTDDCFAVLLNRYKILYLTSSGLAPTGELRGCLVSPLIILPRGGGGLRASLRILGVALPTSPRAFLGLVVKRIGFCFVAIRGCALTRFAPPLHPKSSGKIVGARYSVPNVIPLSKQRRYRAAGCFPRRNRGIRR